VTAEGAGFVARHFQTGKRIGVRIEGPRIAAVEPADGADDADLWVAPAFWDIQTNGRWGVSYSDPALTVDQVAAVVRAQAALGTARLCPTLITAPFDAFVHGLKTIAGACEADPEIAAMVAGVHVEGPYLSGVEGYRGAHPLDAVRDPNWDEFRRFQDAAGGRIALVTIAPERPGAIAFITRAVAAGVAVALGHTAADGATLRAAVDAGATLSTHLGNGVASPLPRHPNPILDQAALDGLHASFIADGHHLDDATLRVLVRAKSPGRTVLVSDASPLAGLPPGTYGPWAVDPSGKIVVAGTPYLAGSNRSMEVGINTLRRAAGLSLSEALATVTRNPARLLGKPEPTVEPGSLANLVLFRCPGPDAPFTLLRTCVDGRWTDARDDAPSPWRTGG